MVPGIFPQLTVRTERKKWQLAIPPPLLSDAAHQVTLSLGCSWSKVEEEVRCGCGEEE